MDDKIKNVATSVRDSIKTSQKYQSDLCKNANLPPINYPSSGAQNIVVAIIDAIFGKK